jgi:hypothetical protein
MNIAKAITTYRPESAYEAFLPKITAASIKYVPRALSEPEADDTGSQIRYRIVYL